MNTLRIESLLAKKYKYKPLPDGLSPKYRQFFRENIPDWLNINGENRSIFTTKGTKICNSYERIVIGDYGAFLEFSDEPKNTKFIIQPGQEYRVNDPQYNRNVKYIWLTVDDNSGIKIYKQKGTVSYADYIPGKFYVSVHEVRP